ncbi:unnamed protein product [Zymoseptoria tritici ST99CH_1A5]|uniref:Uncharacterized protein n=1 Tax=Zymoseptoria tritici ST99CH_1A5 TaxID=1276529 RepID=A0A1Y6L611_ZYMTR|nr:unnamed protein product [Zymoseptoria tritici ST99CH_3D1]SMY19942.1 unnamed protein product [Zymoseptoria tritici ST99CH_1A5]
MAEPPQDDAKQLEPSLQLLPIHMKEAALDSPSWRALTLHFSDNIDAVERWLDGYVKAATRLVAEVSSLEVAVNAMLSQSTPPSHISEAVLDHDYTMLAMRRYGEGARDFWQSTLRGIKRYDAVIVDPIKTFLNHELRTFKDARRVLESAQKNFDAVVTRFLAQSKAKESSSLREDAFQLHEARKLYLKSSMDYCVQAPQLRAALDRLLVKIFTEQWKEMRASRDASAATFAKCASEMERVRGWSREMETSERAFKRELIAARRQIEENAEQMFRPSRELEDYNTSTIPYLGTGASSAAGPDGALRERAEKQGWLAVRTVTGKPARTVWPRRWYFVKNGIFGWLVQGTRSGGVEESERTGVLLCSVRPAFQEERRFCLEVKTKDNSVILQAETQQELSQWISAFEGAKRKALEDPASTEMSHEALGIDPAFAISHPVAPEFAVKAGDGHMTQGSEEGGTGPPDREGTGLSMRASFDVSQSRRVMSIDKESDGLREGTRDHAARIIQKLDLHKRSTASPQLSQGPASGGIASLISASHNILPVGPGSPPPAGAVDGNRRNFTLPTARIPSGSLTSSLAPSTLVNPPAATNLSHTAVVVSGERDLGLGRADGSGMPSGILANLWGSSNWGYINRLGELAKPRSDTSLPASPALRSLSISQDDSIVMDGMGEAWDKSTLPATERTPTATHRKTMSVGPELSPSRSSAEDGADAYPAYYPLPLKAQHAQFRMLFPAVPRSEKVVLVFRATWNPNEQQEFPGRVYVTEREIYFFSNHLGLVLITGVSLNAISEVTAAPGRDCDFLYLHLKESSRQDELRRITIKVFLEPLKLLQRRLNHLVRNAASESPDSLEHLIKALTGLEDEVLRRSSDAESWEDVAYDTTDARSGDPTTPQRRRERNIKASLRIDGNLYGETAKTGREVQRFKLPAQPVRYAPQGMQANISRDFNVSAKALFHVMFGDKSAVFQLLYSNRWATTIVRAPWVKVDGAHWKRTFSDSVTPGLVIDTQTIDIFNDHLCYAVTNEKTLSLLPHASSFRLVTKLVITHTAKSRCKLAVFQSLLWQQKPPLGYFKRLIERQALNSLEADALDLTTIAMDQVAKLGSHSKTNKAVEIFGVIGQQAQPQAAQIDSSQVPRLGDALASSRARPDKQLGLPRLVLNDLFAQGLGLLGVIFDVFIAIGQGAISICTGHTMLVAVLAVSICYNSWYSYRDGMVWYHDRSTSSFMLRMGVSPEPQMSKAVYLSDIETLITPAAENSTFDAFESHADQNIKTCRSTFAEQLLTSPFTSTSAPTSARLQRTRDSIARYRHDLLVALRVVNRVEENVVSAEWEDWVRTEARKCAKVEAMLRKGHGGAKSDAGGADPGLTADLGAEFEQYCKSCRVELPLAV